MKQTYNVKPLLCKKENEKNEVPVIIKLIDCIEKSCEFISNKILVFICYTKN